ncbi:MAG TPA: bifunctional (p)ppGpp synthetase/guanosine-3',5'-bis(diphosphate) 3'-pyrophosphohydrolase [Rhodocyclaceae bacterium]
MVSVVHSVGHSADDDISLARIAEGLSAVDAERVGSAARFARDIYEERLLGSGESVWAHALGTALIAAGIKLDVEGRCAALLFAVPAYVEDAVPKLASRFGEAIAQLVGGLSRLDHLRPIARGFVADADSSAEEKRAQIEILRKMLLAMVEDIRVVLLRLASRTQTLRHYARHEDELRVQVARETLDIYSPLANRLGIWELKWELEDLAFRYLYPDTYKTIASQLDEKRIEREQFIATAIETLHRELAAMGIKAEIQGRPKHIYSIWNKMRRKDVPFDEVYDVRALRVLVDEVKDCYSVLGLVHNLWAPISKEFDDYISRPKGNNYRSLHTAVHCDDGRSLEIQIRTHEMHRHAELGVAAHWRYKEGGARGDGDRYEDKIAWLRQLLSWRDEVAGSSDWVQQYKQAALHETIYVLTPQGRVIDLPLDATPVDFAYRLHTDLGHRCRGAKVDGVLVPLNTPLKTAQRVEIVAAKQGGPSRDWLNPDLGYLTSKSARGKVRQWFASLQHDETVAEGRATVGKELQRAGLTSVNHEQLAARLHFAKADDLYAAMARGDVSGRQLAAAARGEEAQDAAPGAAPVGSRQTRASDDAQSDILIEGVGKVLTQLARCCKPAPPDPIGGFITRGKGVSIHRADCASFAHLAAMHPERVLDTEWGGKTRGVFGVDILIDADDRQGLLRDVSDVLARERVNVTAVKTQSKQARATMRFTAEIENLDRLQVVLKQLQGVAGVVSARRAGGS